MNMLRKTKISEKVLQLLEHQTHPVSVNWLLKTLASHNLTPNKTTLYRLMDKLLALKQLSSFSINGVTYYEMQDNHHHHHHHFFCKKCEQAFCLDTCIINKHFSNLSSFLPNKNFSLESHDFNLFGICDSCNINSPETV